MRRNRPCSADAAGLHHQSVIGRVAAAASTAMRRTVDPGAAETFTDSSLASRRPRVRNNPASSPVRALAGLTAAWPGLAWRF